MNPFQKFSEQVVKNARVARLYDRLRLHMFDGTELFNLVDQALPGPENKAAATRLKKALAQKYHGSVPGNVVFEELGGYFEQFADAIEHALETAVERTWD